MPGFPGIPQEGVDFIRQLKKNNRREWFQARKDIYERSVKAPMTELVLAMGDELRTTAPELIADPAKSIYRIYRDTRFSKDKSPYKTWVAAVFPPRGLPKHASAGLYFHFSPDELFVGGGLYAPGSSQLLAVRKHIAANADALRAILKGPRFRRLFCEMEGEQLKRIPKGFSADHPAADLLVYKQFLGTARLDPGIITSPKLLRQVHRHFEALVPFIRFFNAPLAKPTS